MRFIFIALLFIFSEICYAIAPTKQELSNKSLLSGEMSREMRAEIINKLRAKPPCSPNCYILEQAFITLTNQTLSMVLLFHVAYDSFVSLPLGGSELHVESIEHLGKDLSTMRSPNGLVFAFLPSGFQQVKISSSIATLDSITLNFPVIPRIVKIDAPNFQILGLNNDQSIQSNVQFIRKPEHDQIKTKNNLISPYFRVTRDLYFGLQSNIETTIERLSPTTDPAILELPLLEFEEVMNSQLKIAERKAILSFEPNESSKSWTSRFSRLENLSLKSGDSRNYHEIWRLKVSPQWHIDLSANAISTVEKNALEGFDYVLKPWSGEAAQISLKKPVPVDAPSMTIGSTHLNVAPGSRSQEINLTLMVNSSRGFQHTIEIPSDLTLTESTINGQTKVLAREGTLLPLPISTGQTIIDLKFRIEKDFENFYNFLAINLKSPSVNSEVRLMPPQSRWVLWTYGPGWGPVVLIWSQIIISGILAFFFSRFKVIPLGFASWFIFMSGLSQASAFWFLFPIGTLFVFGYKRISVVLNPLFYNFRQIILIVLCILSCVVLYKAMSRGLLGLPDMSISGNGSSARELIWYNDRLSENLVRPYVVSLPLIYYRGIMLAWSLWSAWLLIRMAPWILNTFMHDGIWKKFSKHKIATLNQGTNNS